MTDFPDWQDPVAIADQIAINGVGLLRNELVVASGVTASLAASASATIGPFTLNSTSYELRLTLTANAVAAICNGQLSVKWFDQGGTHQLAQKTFSAIASTGGHVISVTGPVRGGQLQVTFTNSSTSLANVQFTYAIVASSRLAANDLFRTITGVGAGIPSLETVSGLNMDAGVLTNATPNVGAGATTSRLLAAYNGPVQFAVVTNSGLADCEVVVAAADTALLVNTSIMFRDFTSGKGRMNQLLYLPMAQCRLQVTNNNAGAQVISFAVTTAEPNVN